MLFTGIKKSIKGLELIIVLSIFVCGNALAAPIITGPVTANHTAVANFNNIPEAWITGAKSSLHIAYGHTSHGSQITDGMTGLVGFMNGLGHTNNLYSYNNGGSDGALDLHDYAMGGDVGYYPAWVNNTRNYLGTPNPATGRGSGANADVNVIMWSWCGQVSGNSAQEMIDEYLTPMTQLEAEYPGIKFVYMTGHLDGTGTAGNLHLRNEQIRNYCTANNKILFDFADIESYDPDALVNYNVLMANDECNYDSDGNGSRDQNWALNWQGSHTQNVDWYSCSSAHSQPLNANMKAYAIWWLWARLAGWDGVSTCANLPVRNIAIADYTAVQTGYSAAGSGNSVLIQSLVFDEDLILNNVAQVLLLGGYDCNYSPNSGSTTIAGTVTISGSAGAVTMDRVIIR